MGKNWSDRQPVDGTSTAKLRSPKRPSPRSNGGGSGSETRGPNQELADDVRKSCTLQVSWKLISFLEKWRRRRFPSWGLLILLRFDLCLGRCVPFCSSRSGQMEEDWSMLSGGAPVQDDP